MKRALCIALLLLASRADAFPTGAQFDLDPMMADGAGGIAFDGAPRWSAHTCAVCHTESENRINVRLESDHPELFTDGWKPSQQYHLRVVLLDQHAGAQYAAAGDNCGGNVTPYKPCDQNGFALEIDDGIGSPKGGFAPVVAGACAAPTATGDIDIYTLEDKTAVIHNGAHHAQTTWDFCWTAPGAGAGVLTAYVAAVDGNGGDGTDKFPADTLGDDVFAGAVPMNEIGGAAPPQTGGCNAAGDGAGLGVLLAIGWLLRRRRRGLALLLAGAALTGCVHVRPRERETLARKNMKFGPDSTEDELDLHMQESREGSSGGYGSSGGGCGCN